MVSTKTKFLFRSKAQASQKKNLNEFNVNNVQTLREGLASSLYILSFTQLGNGIYKAVVTLRDTPVKNSDEIITLLNHIAYYGNLISSSGLIYSASLFLTLGALIHPNKRQAPKKQAYKK